MPTAPFDQADLDQVAQALTALPQVLRARVASEFTPAGEPRLTAHLTLAEQPEAEREPEVEQQRVDEWQQIYEWVYGELPASGGFGDNFVGWHSSYSSLPIPLDEMREWRDATIARILAHRPRRILEIGVGTGLLMAHLAPHCEQYTATDFSPTVVASLTGQLAALPADGAGAGAGAGLADRVEFLVREANDFTGLAEDHYDLVVINSVIQYFPNADYLAEVITGALRHLRPGGAVFAGDIRNLRLLPSFRTAIAGRGLLGLGEPEQALAAVRQSSQDERELLIDPDFFAAVRRQSPLAGALEIQVKRAAHHNELSRHRYDAVLYRSPAPALELDDAEQLDFTGAEDLRKRLTEDRPAALRLVSVPNLRVRHESAAARLLEQLAPLEQVVAELEPTEPTGADPEDFYRLAEELGYRAAVTWSASGAPDEVDVVLVRDADPAAAVPYLPSGSLELPFTAYGNDPARNAASAALLTALRGKLAAVLPAHLVPAVLVLDAS
ncbi:class I SAM-dependent methyltransferase [Kitasatospora sp. NBC_01287]|uniref:class I SAM-dependent methyltransferase n=1 Tax=Kitasatospora sp. NBC_01287 TaxID=2903573 RepID=UPI00225641E8|nr:class I SAM-dependent methyltransferase [Kitasatospora sp. NBC_01287]MCX4750283.1 class I SAM-dependent methyltransferase [Kitasatospora sp. NBC_01287]